MGTFFATHEAELYHYGRKGMRRGRHLPDVLDPTRALVGTRAASGEALTTRFYDRYRKDKASRRAVREGRDALRGTLFREKSYDPSKVLAERMRYGSTKERLTNRPNPINDSLKTMTEFSKSQGPHKTSRDYSVEYRTRHRVAQRQEEAKREAEREAERNAAKNAIARGYATKTASRAAASGAATGNAVRELNRQIGQERLRRSTRGASVGSSRSSYENTRTEQSVSRQKQRVAKAAERYQSSLGNVSGGAQQAYRKNEDARTQDSRTKQLQREARETRENVARKRRIASVVAQAKQNTAAKAAQAGAAEAIRANERRRTEASKNQFSSMPKWKQNLERAKSQKAASENAEHIRRKKQYTESQRRRHLEENRGHKSKRPY